MGVFAVPRLVYQKLGGKVETSRLNGILAESSRKEALKLDPSLGLPGPEKYGMGDDILEAALNSRGRKLVSLSGDHGPSQEELYRRDVMSEDSLKAGE